MKTANTVLTMPNVAVAVEGSILTPLLRPEFPVTDPRCLPFVRDLTKAEKKAGAYGRLFWAPDALPPHLLALDEGEQGTACAAAWLIYKRHHQGNGINLASIVPEMPKKPDTRCNYFFAEIERALELGVMASTPKMHAENAERWILTCRRLAAERHALRRRKRA